jgi:hypothetical protein
MIRTVERLKLFNGSWLKDDPPENKSPAIITLWKITKGIPKAHGLTQTDQKGMLDTARNTHFAKMRQPTLSPETEIETSSDEQRHGTPM